MLRQILQTFLKQWKNRKPQQRNRICKDEPNGHFITKNYDS